MRSQSSQQQRYEIPPGTKASKCKGQNCQKTIFFIQKPNDPTKKMPVNQDGTPHWLTCVDSETFRRQRDQRRGHGSRD